MSVTATKKYIKEIFFHEIERNMNIEYPSIGSQKLFIFGVWQEWFLNRYLYKLHT